MALLKAIDWNVFIVLDACRQDYFWPLRGPVEYDDALVVRSAAVCTQSWIRRMMQFDVFLSGHDGSQILYFNANPVITRELRRMVGKNIPSLAKIDLIDVWVNGWAHHTDLRIPTVHPEAVNNAVLDWIERHGQPERMVVHYLQPHSPYIGATPLAMGRWGRGGQEFVKTCHALKRPDKEAKAGRLDWELLRRAYADNLRLVWKWALRLIESLAGTIVVTADHGEVLGEHGGKFGHECNWVDLPELHRVPWLVFKNGRAPSARRYLKPELRSPKPVAESDLRAKLEALGYV